MKDIEELLKYLQENDIIDLAKAQANMELKKKEDILKNHPYNIWLASDGYWKSYVTDETKKSGKRLLKKKKEEDLKNAIVEDYRNNINYSFKARFDDWTVRQQKLGRSDNTIYKYQCDYKRFIAGDKIEKMDIRKIDDIVLGEYIKRLSEDNEKNVRWKALKELFGYFNGIFKKAMRDRIITENPCEYVDLPLFKSKCYIAPEKTTEERTLSDIERKVLYNKVHHSKNVGDMAVEFTMFTGMRVGELAALKWEDIDLERQTIRICRSEKRNRLTKERYISLTKNSKIRTIPLTDDMWKVLQKVKKYEMQNGLLGEYIFQDENGRVNASKISNCARNRTQSTEFVNSKSVHAIRRTLNSNMRTAGVSTPVAASIFGHTEKVNEENYTYDMCDMQDKRAYMEKAAQM